MFKKIAAGQTSNMIPIRVFDTSSSTGAYLSGLTHASSGLVGRYRRAGESAWTSITIVTATAGTFTSGGWAVPTSGPSGSYEVHVPDAAFAAGARWVEIEYSGVTNMQPVSLLIELDAVNYQDSSNFGLSTLSTLLSRIVGTLASGTHNAQSGDAFARLGAPAGASIAADIATRLASASYTAPANATIAAIEADTQDIQSRLPAALVGGRMDSSVGAMAANTLTASALATDAVAEIQSGLSTSVVTDAIKAKTDHLPSDPADQSALEAAITNATSPLATKAQANAILGSV